ncbi:hypothetical protein WDZ92_36995, partial [Nostoc sp. NIES-2111]
RELGFLFREPDEAVEMTSWGQSEIGLDCRLSPAELAREFGWTEPATGPDGGVARNRKDNPE